MKYIVFLLDGYTEFNKKSHDLYLYFKEDDKFDCKENVNINYILNFILENKDNEDICVICYSQKRQQYELEMIKYLNLFKKENFKLKIFIFTFDFWFRGDAPYSKVIKLIFKAKNHYVFTFANNMKQLNDAHNYDYTAYTDKILFDTNVWNCYNSSYTIFNNDPIEKICVSGAASPISYPERAYLIKLSGQNNNIISLNYVKNDGCFTEKLNKYLCCFTSSVYVKHLKNNKVMNTHMILLKVFEILASGSLLLCPIAEEKYLNKIGLYDNVNMLLVDMNKFIEMQKYILLLENRDIINGIRKAGYEHAKENLNSKIKYIEIKNKIESICSQTI
jgi:hypothetical protein